MSEEGRITLARLHELTLLYLGLAEGTDHELDPAETKEIALKLRRWQPDKDPALIDHVIREATLSYTNGPTAERLQEAIDALSAAFPDRLRRAIVRDLADIARADGRFDSREMQYIRDLARMWNIDLDEETTSEANEAPRH